MLTPAVEFYAVVGVFTAGLLLLLGGLAFGRRGAMGRGSTSEERDVRSTVQLYDDAPFGAPPVKVAWYVRLWRWVKGVFGR